MHHDPARSHAGTRASCCSRSVRAASAEPTYTCATRRSRRPSSRSSSATRSSRAPRTGDESASRGSGGPTGRVTTATTQRENLCVNARFTGRDIDGGYAELTTADERFCLPLPDDLTDEQAAPLLCGGLIGYRALTFTGDATNLGLYGFGSAAHIITQLAVYQGRKVFAFTRPHDTRTQEFARTRGATWAGGSDELPPEPLEAAIIFASAGELVPQALKALAPGGAVVAAGIHMSDIPSFPYDDLWQERSIRSVANLTRKDGEEFLTLAPRVPIRTTITTYPLEQAEQALTDLRAGRFEGSAVVVP